MYHRFPCSPLILLLPLLVMATACVTLHEQETRPLPAGGRAWMMVGKFELDPPLAPGEQTLAWTLNASGSIVSCYNSLAAGGATTTVPCGLLAVHCGAGCYIVTFSAPVAGRFPQVQPQAARLSSVTLGGAGNPNDVGVTLYATTGAATDAQFFLSLH